MLWHYNLSGHGEVLYRDMPIYDATSLANGQALCLISGANGTCLQDPASAGGIADFVGVLMETPASSISALASGTIKYGKVVINPDAVYLAEYDSAAGNDVDVVSSTSTATTLGTADDNLDGGWLYCNSGTGEGQLAYIGAASTTVMTLDTTTAWSTTPDSTTDVILIRPSMSHPAGGGKDLDSTFVMLANDEDETGECLILENYISGATVPGPHPLNPTQHHMKKNLHNVNVKFWGDAYFTDNALRGATSMYSS